MSKVQWTQEPDAPSEWSLQVTDDGDTIDLACINDKWRYMCSTLGIDTLQPLLGTDFETAEREVIARMQLRVTDIEMRLKIHQRRM